MKRKPYVEVLITILWMTIAGATYIVLASTLDLEKYPFLKQPYGFGLTLLAFGVVRGVSRGVRLGIKERRQRSQKSENEEQIESEGSKNC